MNKLKGWLALVLLLLSWCALYWITGSRTPWNQFHVNNDGSGAFIWVISQHRIMTAWALLRR